MSTEELQQPVEKQYNTIFDPTTCVKKGLCPVTVLRGQDQDPLESHSLYFEVHGEGPEKLVFIMGLNSTSFSWSAQVEHFGRDPRYSVLVFDNRGVGNSGTPRGPYSTSGMAEDVIVLLDYIGWTGERSIHVIGASLGGMIALELASKIPERIISLQLVVTTAGGYPWNNLPPWKGLGMIAKTFFIKEPRDRVPHAIDSLFPKEWLDAVNENDPAKRTNREIQQEAYERRVAAMRRQTPMGSISQMVAGITHRVSKERLRKIAETIPKVLILTGDEDHLVDPSNSVYLKSCMPEAEFIQWEHTGHGLHMQWRDRFNTLVERIVKEGRERLAQK